MYKVAPTCSPVMWRTRMQASSGGMTGVGSSPFAPRCICSAGNESTDGAGAPPHASAVAVNTSLPPIGRFSGTTARLPAAVTFPRNIPPRSRIETVAPGASRSMTAMAVQATNGPANCGGDADRSWTVAPMPDAGLTSAPRLWRARTIWPGWRLTPGFKGNHWSGQSAGPPPTGPATPSRRMSTRAPWS